MNSIEIVSALSNDPDFLGCFSINHLPQYMIIKPAKVVINLDESWKEGSHWVGVFIDRNKAAIYFDSYGRQPPEAIETFIERNSNYWSYSKYKLQGDLSTKCGLYCIKFLKNVLITWIFSINSKIVQIQMIIN